MNNIFNTIFVLLAIILGGIILVAVACLICLPLAAANALQGFKSKIFVYLSVGANFLFHVILFILLFDAWSPFLFAIVPILLNVVVFVFTLNNCLPAVIPMSEKAERRIKPERLLRELKARYEYGIITKEEYDKRREKILSSRL